MLLTEAEIGALLNAKVDTHQQRVANGVQLLDAKRPGWWRQGGEKEINLSILDINNCDTCILGQLYGYYLDGKDGLGIDCGWAYGFAGDSLNDLWRDVISVRRVVAAAP